MVTYLSSLVQLCGGRRNTTNKYFWHVWGVLVMNEPQWVCSSSQQHVLSNCTLWFQNYSAGTVQRALPKPKLLRFMFLGILQGHRLGWACVCALPRFGAAQATRCLASAIFQAGWCILSLPSPSSRFPGCVQRSQVCCVSLLI